MFSLIVLLCTFVNDYDVEYNCAMHIKSTPDCAVALSELRKVNPGWVSAVSCQKNLKQSLITKVPEILSW